MPRGYSNKTGLLLSLGNKNCHGKHWKVKDTSKYKGGLNTLGKHWKVKDSSKMGIHPNCSVFQKDHKINVGRTEEKSGNWKGEVVGCKAVHVWVRKKKGDATNYKCVDCGQQARDWTNKDHSYKRVLEDYFPRCVSCHRKYDNKYNRKK